MLTLKLIKEQLKSSREIFEGEIATLPQYITGILSILVFITSIQQLLKDFAINKRVS